MGKRSWAFCYGLHRLGQPARVEEHKVFPVGSNSKAFTVAGLAMIIDWGKFSWDDQPEEKLPGFRLHAVFHNAVPL